MNPNVNLIRIAGLAAIWSLSFVAAAHASPPQYTLDRIVDLALERNLDLQRSENSVRAGEATLDQSRRESLPNLTLNASTSRNINPRQETTNASAGLSAAVTLFNGFSDQLNVDRLEASLNVAEFGRDRVKGNLILQASSGFFDAAANEALVKSAAENYEAQKAQLTLVQGFYEAGRRALADLYQQQAAVAQSEYELITASAAHQVSKLSLWRLIGLDPADSASLAPPDISDLKIEPLAQKLDDLKAAALQERPEMHAADAQIAASEFALKRSRSPRYPTLSLNASAGTGYNSSAAGRFSGQFFDDGRNSSAGLSLSLPIFDRSRTSLAVQQAKLALDNDRLAREDLTRQIANEVEQAYLNLQSAGRQLQAADAQVNFARQSLEAMTERYRVGAAAMIELTQARAQFTQASGLRIRAAYKLLSVRLSLDYAVGRLGKDN